MSCVGQRQQPGFVARGILRRGLCASAARRRYWGERLGCNAQCAHSPSPKRFHRLRVERAEHHQKDSTAGGRGRKKGRAGRAVRGRGIIHVTCHSAGSSNMEGRGGVRHRALRRLHGVLRCDAAGRGLRWLRNGPRLPPSRDAESLEWRAAVAAGRAAGRGQGVAQGVAASKHRTAAALIRPPRPAPPPAAGTPQYTREIGACGCRAPLPHSSR